MANSNFKTEILANNFTSLTKDDVEDLSRMKDEIQYLFEEFSDEENLSGMNFDLRPYNHESDNSDDLESQLKSEGRKNRRKALAPQRAIQLLTRDRGSIENSSESSQDNIDSNFNSKDELLNEEDYFNELECDENLPDLKEQQSFKNLQEEADGEVIDEEIIDNVKDEWRAHWGVKCNMCEQVFPFKTEFDKHYQENYNLPPVYTCTFCNKSAEKYSTFRSHCYRHITEGRYKCSECSKGFSLQSMLHVHILAKHTKAKPYMCEECGKSFVTKPGLKIHLKKHKAEIKEDYPCVECGKVLHTRGGLTSHMNVHRLGRRFMCDVCGKTFTQKVNMQQHVKQHTGDKPHSCTKCGKTFAEKSHLARHYSFHSEERPYKCNVCQKMYKTERCLKVHSLVHAAERPFVCGYCSKGFLSSTKLKQHYNIHTGERPYKCKYCERTFTNYPNWLKHTRRSHKVDHKTGAELVPKSKAKPSKVEPKEELPPTPAPIVEPPSVASPPDPIPLSSSSVDYLVDPVIGDMNLASAEELLLQQGLMNFPLLDEKISFNQQIDLLAVNPSTSIGTMNYLVPFFQTTLPGQRIIHGTSQSVLPMSLQLSDLIATNFVSQPCE